MWLGDLFFVDSKLEVAFRWIQTILLKLLPSRLTTRLLSPAFSRSGNSWSCSRGFFGIGSDFHFLPNLNLKRNCLFGPNARLLQSHSVISSFKEILDSESEKTTISLKFPIQRPKTHCYFGNCGDWSFSEFPKWFLLGLHFEKFWVWRRWWFGQEFQAIAWANCFLEPT